MDIRGALDSGRAAINQLGAVMDSLDLDQAHGEGYVAGEHGAPRSHNPHQPGHFLHDAWNDGWDEAWGDFEADRKKMNGMGPEGFVAIVLLIGLAALIVKGIVWLAGIIW